MRVVNEDVLNRFRGRGPCGYCRRPCRQLQPHHVMARGIGSASRLDLPLNLIPLCAFPEGNCHETAHLGRIPRHDLFAIIAAREVMTPELLRDQLFRLQRAPSECRPCPLCEGKGVVRVAKRFGWRQWPCVCGSGVIAADGSYWREQPRKLAGT